MQKLSSGKLLSVLSILLILLLTEMIFCLALWWFLPNEGVELKTKESYKAKYQRVNFSNMLVYTKVAKQPKQKVTTAYSMNRLVLKGLYGSEFNGFAIVAKKALPKKTTIVSVGETYEGYRLKRIELNQVTFSKNEKDYILKLEESQALKTSNVISKVQKDNPIPTAKAVAKSDITYYAKNPNKIWKDIAINEVKRNGKIEGFKVNRIKKGSKFSELGLEVGDIIIRANNIDLKSYNEAIKLYKNIDNMDVLELVVKRNNQEKEILYEIH